MLMILFVVFSFFSRAAFCFCRTISQEEKERLAKIKASLNEEDLQGIIDKTIALK